jgi:histidine triad (HIT) family protein
MSLLGAYEPNNIFARILRGEIPCAKVTENDHTLVIMDAFPQSPGHTLIIPKLAGRTMLDLPQVAIAPVFKQVQRVAKAMNSAFKPDGIVVTQLNGSPAGQTVFHLHVHLIPRYDNLPLERHHQGKAAEMTQLLEQARVLNAALESVA